MIAPTYAVALGQPVLPGCVAAGHFDGRTATLACATTGGRAFLHAVGSASGASAQVRFLNINRDITALGTARLVRGAACSSGATGAAAGWDLFDAFSSATPDASAGEGASSAAAPLLRDVLLVGTTTSLQAYDAEVNADVFHRDMPEAVSALAAGPWPWANSGSGEGGGAGASGGSVPPLPPLDTVFVGGDASVTGVGGTSGHDVWWTSVGDTVAALVVTDVDGDGREEVLIGSADGDVRAYRGHDVIFEATETDAVSALTGLDHGAFAYGLCNGTLGVYSASAAAAASAAAGGSGLIPPSGLSPQRAWRVKAKGKCVAIAAFDFDGDGVREVAAIWASGKIEIRKAGTGELLFREQLTAPGAGLAVALPPPPAAAAAATGGKQGGAGGGGGGGSGGGGALIPLLLVVATDGELRAYGAVDPATLLAYRTASGMLGTAVVKDAAPPPRPAIPPEKTARSGSAGKGGPQPPAGQAPTSSRKNSEVTAAEAAAAAAAAAALAVQKETAAIRAAIAEKAALEARLMDLEATAAAADSAIAAASFPFAIPAKTAVALRLEVSAALRAVDLILTVSNPDATVLRAASVWSLDAALFGHGRESSTAVSPAALPSIPGGEHTQQNVHTLRVPLSPALDLATDLRVQVLVGSRGGARLFSVLELPFSIPKYSSYQLLLPPYASPSPPTLAASAAAAELTGVASPTAPTGIVLFHLPDRAARVALWISSAFAVPAGAITALPSHGAPQPVVTGLEDALRLFGGGGGGGGGMAHPLPPAPTAESGGGGAGPLSLDVRFACVRTGGTTMLRLAVAHEGGGAAIIQCDDMALAGQVLQDLSAFLSITSLESLVDFPQSLTSFGSTLTRLQELSTLRLRLSGDLAESQGGVKVLVLRAEDARVRGDMRGVQAHYAELGGLMAELVRDNGTRAGVHASIVECLKETNKMIALGSALRVGEPRARVVAACRAAMAGGREANPLQMLAVLQGGAI